MIRNKVLYSITLLLCVAFAILYNVYSSFQVLVVAFFLPLFMLAVLYRLKKSIHIEVDIPLSIIEKEGCLCIHISLHNASSWFPITKGIMELQYGNDTTKEKGKKKIPFSVDRKSKESLSIEWKEPHCGNIHMQIKRIRIYDYLGLFCVSLHAKGSKLFWENDYLVLPSFCEVVLDKKLVHIETDMDSNIYSPYKKGEDATEIFSIREYEEGDNLHRIHWKLSYKRNQLMVKDYSLPVDCAISILVDLHLDNKKEASLYLDGLYQTAFNLSFALAQKSLLHYIVWFDVHKHQMARHLIENEEDIYSAFQEIYQSSLYEDKSIMTEEYARGFGGVKMSELFYICTWCDEITMSTMGEALGTTQLQVLSMKDGGKKHERTVDARGIAVSTVNIQELTDSLLEWSMYS